MDLESEGFGTHLQPFLGDKTSHFMHELVSFAKSPFDIIAYDGKVKYDWPANYPMPAGHTNTRTTEVGGAASSGQAPTDSSAAEGTLCVLITCCVHLVL